MNLNILKTLLFVYLGRLHYFLKLRKPHGRHISVCIVRKFDSKRQPCPTFLKMYSSLSKNGKRYTISQFLNNNNLGLFTFTNKNELKKYARN